MLSESELMVASFSGPALHYFSYFFFFTFFFVDMFSKSLPGFVLVHRYMDRSRKVIYGPTGVLLVPDGMKWGNFQYR